MRHRITLRVATVVAALVLSVPAVALASQGHHSHSGTCPTHRHSGNHKGTKGHRNGSTKGHKCGSATHVSGMSMFKTHNDPTQTGSFGDDQGDQNDQGDTSDDDQGTSGDDQGDQNDQGDTSDDDQGTSGDDQGEDQNDQADDQDDQGDTSGD